VGARVGLGTLLRKKKPLAPGRTQTTDFGHHVHGLVTIPPDTTLFPLQIIREVNFYERWTGSYIKESGRGPLHITLHNNFLEGLIKDISIMKPT
jgi:hypothetical protein